MAFEQCRVGGFAGWRSSQGAIEVFFGGKGPTGLEVKAALHRILPEGVDPSWLQQVHSATVLDARLGDSGQGDALITQRHDMALAVVTADCVPILLANDREVVAVHAGWRGIAQSILSAAFERLTKRCH